MSFHPVVGLDHGGTACMATWPRHHGQCGPGHKERTLKRSKCIVSPSDVFLSPWTAFGMQ